MQKVAAYLLERRDDMQSPEARATEVDRIKLEVRKWLKSKGATNAGSSGAYQPEDRSSGAFQVHEATDNERTLWWVVLNEDTAEGRRFTMELSITSGCDRVSVYATLEAGWTTAHVLPVPIDPRCPKIIRDLFEHPGGWFHGESSLEKPRFVLGFKGGEALAREIESADRSVPIVAISKQHGELSLPELDSRLGYDLIGLANVRVMDEEASWAITDTLGQEWACYWGAVRLYWPRFAKNQDRYAHPLWTRERLRVMGESIETRDLFRKQLRTMIFRAAALSVARPLEIDSIRQAENRRTWNELRTRASSLEEYKDLAESYSIDNDALRVERDDSRRRIGELEQQINTLESENLALKTHLKAAKGLSPADSSDDAISPGGDDSIDRHAPPVADDIRFYKKLGSGPSHDVLIRVGDCGCNRWAGAHKADKAKKGIAKLEGGRDDWKQVQHCASCKGGGMWKVRW